MRFHHLPQKAIRWFGAREPVVLVALLVVVASGWGFVELAEEVLEGDTQAFDEWVLQILREPEQPDQLVGPTWFSESARDVTALGGIPVLTLFTVAAAGYLLLDGKRRMLILLVVATLTGLGLSFGMKQIFARERPAVVPHLSEVYTLSFPSGHAMMSTVVYLTLGTLLATVLPRRRLRIYVFSLSIVLSLLVGLSRIYLGVHYPSDVLAGWSAGLVWALACWLVADWLQRRGEVEQPDEGRTD